MKTLFMIGGTMGVGKTTVCKKLNQKLPNSVLLDGDWCWDANPFQVNDETKKMVIENICFLLNQFLHCSAYENVVFCWVMHEQSIINDILGRIDQVGCDVKVISLICSAETLQSRIEKDVVGGLRTPDVWERSKARLPLYEKLNSQKIVTDHKRVDEIVEEIYFA